MHINKQEAEKIIDELGILPALKGVGDARVVGSVALDVIVKRDVDIHVVVKDLFAAIDIIYRHLISHSKINKVKIKKFGGSSGILVGVDEYESEKGTWSIDIWVTTDEKTTGFADVQKLGKDMTQEHREVIIKIKNAYCSEIGGTSGGLSPKIYKAVVYGGVRDVEGFRKWNG